MYSKPNRELRTQFCKEKNIQCLLSLFFNLKTFYVAPPPKRAKSSCLSKICQGMHLNLKRVNFYHNMKKLDKFVSVTKYLGELNRKDSELYPELKDQKEINIY